MRLAVSVCLVFLVIQGSRASHHIKGGNSGNGGGDGNGGNGFIQPLTAGQNTRYEAQFQGNQNQQRHNQNKHQFNQHQNHIEHQNQNHFQQNQSPNQNYHGTIDRVDHNRHISSVPSHLRPQVQPKPLHTFKPKPARPNPSFNPLISSNSNNNYRPTSFNNNKNQFNNHNNFNNPGFQSEGTEKRPKYDYNPTTSATLPKDLVNVRCFAVGTWSGQPKFDQWCVNNCLHNPPHCPSHLCFCGESNYNPGVNDY